MAFLPAAIASLPSLFEAGTAAAAAAPAAVNLGSLAAGSALATGIPLAGQALAGPPTPTAPAAPATPRVQGPLAVNDAARKALTSGVAKAGRPAAVKGFFPEFFQGVIDPFSFGTVGPTIPRGLGALLGQAQFSFQNPRTGFGFQFGGGGFNRLLAQILANRFPRTTGRNPRAITKPAGTSDALTLAPSPLRLSPFGTFV